MLDLSQMPGELTALWKPDAPIPDRRHSPRATTGLRADVDNAQASQCGAGRQRAGKVVRRNGYADEVRNVYMRFTLFKRSAPVADLGLNCSDPSTALGQDVNALAHIGNFETDQVAVLIQKTGNVANDITLGKRGGCGPRCAHLGDQAVRRESEAKARLRVEGPPGELIQK